MFERDSFVPNSVPGRNRVPGTGSGDRFSGSGEPVPGIGPGFGWVPTGSAVPRFWVQFPRLRETGFRTQGIVKVPVQKVACPRFRKFRCSMGSDGFGSVPEVWTEQVLGTGFREPEVLRRFRVPEIPFPRVRKLLCTLKVYFCTLNVNSCKLKYNYSCTFKVYFCTWRIYFSTLKYTFVLRKYTFVL